MTAIEGVAEIPATVTIPGETLLDIIARLISAEAESITDDGETPATRAFGNAICDLFEAAFGEMWPECQFGELADCQCPVCRAERQFEEVRTPLYALACERAMEAA